MNSNSKILILVEDYLGEHEPEKVPEEIYVEYNEILKQTKKFNTYCKKNGIFKKLSKMKKSKAQLERRKIFIKWYITVNPNKPMNKCVVELTSILFVSKSTIHAALFDYY